MKRRAESALYVSRVYKTINEDKPEPYWNYNIFKPTWGSPDDYEVIRKVGRGKYSDVFEGERTSSKMPVVIKILKPVKKKKIRREIKILQNLAADEDVLGEKKRHSGQQNIISLLDTIMDPLSKTKCLVFEYVNACDFKTLFPRLSSTDIQYYMYQLLLALDFCHSRGIIHRDVKPHNVMIDHRLKKLRLIDWGLAEFYHPGKEYNVRVASRYFKGPELLVNMRTYDYSLDVWSYGCMFAGMIFVRHPFFHGRNNEDQLVKIVKILGSAGLFAYLSKYNLRLPSSYEPYKEHDLNPDKPYRRRPLDTFVKPENKRLATPDAIDLLSLCLRYDHQTRPTCREALAHRYFMKVKKDAAKIRKENEAISDIACRHHPEGHKSKQRTTVVEEDKSKR
mmetsp:Transcript_11924/g.23468  ORF Transcript_11924/g.23468 Transcript_11924/m.23468 type:complete len:393 (-) Transcript_11924:114-1292(-)|eukprot:CAMPEP_0167800522 /NCGR_PEP_ID=MMETSP0111_2-20121227/17788_1 /TAXON_ID=91324 /ORGANISM="Lotharella globosa, Strain CCCM811" /LENGTH=392 /DNA_ID=CAMNT_0007695811 /DNA_START=41 /DNA_END=1215 /DNA_ORIENTATION=-